ncbi:protein kinase domain-containing protein [Candidatus Uabimicrobium amorphum]|uniref:Serine/threonine protein kinase n=1 Tax=Uabimicrobium amorphum TaxID=2596890 RepID=A0A5S9F3Q0_UABAM|nr:protein kinase [Candidatus Uabimicrobium amorphum]BBM84967.1 serine/threonine protein kinase [Candidatus Uabimicrobium amorphum]
MLIKIFHTTNNKVFQLDVTPETSLREICNSLVRRGDLSSHLDVVFVWNKNVLKWESTIKELKVFYNFIPEQHQIQVNAVKKPQTFNTDEIFYLLQKTLDEKNKSWHEGHLNPDSAHSQTPKVNYIFAQRYQIITEIREKNIIQTYQALDIKEQRIVYLFVGYKSIIDYHPVANTNQLSILKTYHVGEYENYSYSAVEYFPGKFLSDIIEKKELSITDILIIFTKLAHTLSTVHESGSIHGNLTARDILLDEHLTPCLIFSGLLYREHPKRTSNPLRKTPFVEEPLYSSPERVFSQKQDAASDIFAFGAILYHTLTNNPPFGCYKDQLIHDDLVAAENFCPEIPSSLARALEAMLAEDASTRPKTMKEIVATLDLAYHEIIVEQIENSEQRDFANAIRNLRQADIEKANAIQEIVFLCCQKNMALNAEMRVFIQAAIQKNEPLALASFKNIPQDLRSQWVERILYKVSLPPKLTSFISIKSLNALVKNRNEHTRRRINRSLVLYNANISLFHILQVIEQCNAQNQEQLYKYLHANKEQLLPVFFILLFENKKHKLKLVHHILTQLNLAVVVDAVTKLKKGEDASWCSLMKNLEQQPKIYFSLLAALNTLLRDKSRNIRWLAGHAFFLLGTTTLVQKYIQHLKAENKITHLLQIINFSGSEIALFTANSLRGSLDDQFLKYIWSLRWSSKDEERILTCQAFGKQKIARGIQFLVETLFSSNRTLRKEAENSIAQIGVSAVGELIFYIRDKDLQNSIQNIFRNLGQQSIAPLASFLERNKDLVEKKTIIQILGLIGGEEAICALLPYLSKEYSTFYGLVKEQMVAQKQHCEEWLLPALKGTLYVRQRVQEILVAIGSAKAIGSLFEDLRCSDTDTEQHITKLIVQIDIKVLENFLDKVPAEHLIKLYCLTNKQDIKQLLENHLKSRVQDFYIFQQFLSSNVSADLKDPDFFCVLVCKLLELSAKLSPRCAQTLVSSFPKESSPYLVDAWYDLWSRHIFQLVLHGELSIQDLKILSPPANVDIYQECIIDTADHAIPYLMEKLQHSITPIGMKIIDLLGKIRSQHAVQQLKNILKNNSLGKFLRQFAHITLCTVNNEIDLLIQFFQQQRGTYLGDETLNVLLEIATTSSANIIVSSIAKLKADEVFRELLDRVLHSRLESILFMPFLEECPKETLKPLLLENINNPNGHVSERAIEFLALCPTKQILNALQVLLMRRSDKSAIIEKSIEKIRQQLDQK